ncbi:MAG: cyclic nucleotide-binding domain-containing protein [Candidatus Magnetomorum sp.]|nr:cyclic nucleotide-binding domain-containing protein [Candidatus Magnetomorum sp.]
MINNLLNLLSAKWDLWFERYQTFLVETEEEREECFKILEEVRHKELNRVAGNSVIDSHAFSGKKINYRLLACRDSHNQKVVGCIRLTKALEAMNVPSSREEYLLEIFEPSLLNHLSITTRLVVIKSYRKTPVSLVLMANASKILIEENQMGILQSSEPSLFPMYKRIGMRPIGPIHNSPSGGHRIPMIIFPDYEYLHACHSPVLPLIKHLDFSIAAPLRQWFSDFEHKQGKIHMGVSLYMDFLEQEPTEDEKYTPKHLFLTKGMSEKGCKNLLTDAVYIDCQVGDVIIAENDGGRNMGFVQKGIVKVMLKDKLVALLGPGDIFGEIAYILNRNRSAQLIAGTHNTQVVFLRKSAIQQLTHEKDRTVLWQNLSSILAQKILLTTQSFQRHN